MCAEPLDVVELHKVLNAEVSLIRSLDLSQAQRTCVRLIASFAANLFFRLRHHSMFAGDPDSQLQAGSDVSIPILHRLEFGHVYGQSLQRRLHLDADAPVLQPPPLADRAIDAVTGGHSVGTQQR